MASSDQNEINKNLLRTLQGLQRQLGMRLTKADSPVGADMEKMNDMIERYSKRVEEMNAGFSDLYQTLRSVTSEMETGNQTLGKTRRAYQNLTADVQTLALNRFQDLKTLDKIEQRSKKNLADMKQYSKELSESLRIDQRLEQTRNKLIAERASKIQKESKIILTDNQAKQLAAQQIVASNQTLTEELVKQMLASGEITGIQAAILRAKGDEINYEEKLVDLTTQRRKETLQILDATESLGNAAKLLGKIPILGKALGSAAEEAKILAQEAIEQDGDISKDDKKQIQIKSITKGLSDTFKDPFAQLTGLATIFKTILDFAFKVDAQIVDLGKSLGVNKKEAEAYRDSIAEIGANLEMSDKNVMLTTKNLLEARSQLADQSGLQKGFAEAELISQVRMTKNVGMQAEEMAKLTDRARLYGKTTEDILDSAISATTALKLQTGIVIDSREVLSEVASIEGQLAANYKNNPTLIAKAVVETRKLGLSLQQARDASKGLLDFESSIGAELEAELLTGKSINLERARALALQGKTAEAAKELASNFGSLEDFQNLNVLAQESLAEAVGMSADELANVLVQEQNIANLSKGVKQDLDERVKLLKAQGKVEEANALMSQTANDEQAKAALMTLNAQEKMGAIMEKIANFAGTLVDNMGLLIGILTTVGALMAAVAVSMVISTGGAALIGAGIAAAAVGVGGAVLGNALTSDPTPMEDGMIDSDGSLIVSGQKGTFKLDKNDKVIAGTDLDKPVSNSSTTNNQSNNLLERKLDRLIAAVEKGGNVYMDGSKVGEALVIGSHKF